MTIYIENVIIDNFAMTYLISDLSYKIGGVRASKTRCLCASAAGTAVAVFYPFIYDGIALFAVRAGLFAVMSLILYAGKRKKTLPLIFLAVTAAVGGAIFFTAFALGGSVSETLRGAYDFSPGAIIVCGWIVCRIIRSAKIKFSRRRAIKNFLRKIRITMGSETLCVEGLIDSGNCVFDEKSALPVMFLSTGGADKLHISGEPENSRNFVGYTSITDINGKSSRLPLFKPDKIEMELREGEFGPPAETLVGIAMSEALGGKNYSAILHPAMLQGGQNEIMGIY